MSLSVLVNEENADPFVPERGLRQGDPLSPLLFILEAEVLARKLQELSNNPENKLGFNITRIGTRIPFLSFADDMMIFTKANQNVTQLTKKIIDEYCVISGQKVNYHKSAFQTTPKVTNAEKQIIQDTINVTHQNRLDKYLGCPIINGRVNDSTFEETEKELKKS